MEIRSSAFKNGETIPQKYTCDGENINPPLEFSNMPPRAKSLCLIVDDPDSPTETWVHWIIWNIDPSLYKISENETPEGSIEGITSFGDIGYGGPCPGSGVHRYFFKLFALDTDLNLKKGSRKEDLLNAMSGHIIAEAKLMGLYERRK